MSAIPIVICLLAQSVAADDGTVDEKGIDFFEKKIRPVLVEHCYRCHSGRSSKPKGGLRLDSREATRAGGDLGPAVVPGKPAESLLLQAIEYKDLEMPPKGKLPDSVIAAFRLWIDRGAVDPRDTAPAAEEDPDWPNVLEARGKWWSLQPLKLPPIPKTDDSRFTRPIDRFVVARLKDAGLTPQQRANKHTLIRRLYLVLTGLPPNPKEIASFVADPSPDAYSHLVERLLASPHFGERWARHWMDVVRFSETHGTEWNYDVHHAWRYRDYLIRAFNEDVPYDDFVREHIAGDLLPDARWNKNEKFNESIIGTMFYRFGEIGHDDCIQFRDVGVDAADNQLDTLTKAFQASTVACARCHDHKLDPISMRDYYALLGILQSSRQVSHTIDAPEVNADLQQQLIDLKPQIQSEVASAWSREIETISRYLRAAQATQDESDTAKSLSKGLDVDRIKQWIATLEAKNSGLEDPLHAWREVSKKVANGATWPVAWKELVTNYENENRVRRQFNTDNFTLFGDFTGSALSGWHAFGQGLRRGATASGELTVLHEGDRAIGSILPAGHFTHSLSDRLNGTLRSPRLKGTKKYVSFHVMGNKQGALRIISNNCQLAYVNYKVLKSEKTGWIKLPTVKDNELIRTYAELVTKLDNPKFPDQLGSLGGGKTMRQPYDKLSLRSFFGITRVVIHDCEETPRDELTHMLPLVSGSVESKEELAARYQAHFQAALQSWTKGETTDDDARWLDWLVRNELIANKPELSPRLEQLVSKYREIEKALATPRVVIGMADDDAGFDHPLFLQGDYDSPAAPIERRYLEVLTSPSGLKPQGSGRAELAEILASSDNPLTARVMVNRVWHYVFGSGIVKTPDDFGHLGEKPTHPRLLDYLTTKFIAEGWSIKQLIRQLVSTETFRMSSQALAESRPIDPNNRLLHHFPTRRLEAEAIRDSILAVSGGLDAKFYGASVYPFREEDYPDRRLFKGPLDGNGRRSVYIRFNLMEAPKFLSAFNIADGKVTQGRRDITNVPSQALALLNDPFVIQQAELWAERLVASSSRSTTERLDSMFRLALGREPDATERARLLRTTQRLAGFHNVPEKDILVSGVVWKDVAHTIFNLKEFIYIR